jgi:hypothetical protein
MKIRRSLVVLLAQLAVTGVAVALNTPTAHGSVGDLAGQLRGVVEGFGNLILVIAAILLGAGMAIRFLPTGSHRTKEAGGSLLDSALILAGVGALGFWLIFFAGDWARTVTGVSNAGIPEPSGPWQLPEGF